MTLRPSRAADSSALSEAATAFLSRALRQAFNFSICSYSTVSGTVRMASPSSVASGEGSVEVKALTPTTLVSPASMARRRSAFDSTSAFFM